MSSVRDKKKMKKKKKYQRAYSRREKRRTKTGGGGGKGSVRGGVCMRLIDNHRQVVSSEKGAVYDTSARYHQRRVQKADPSSGPTIQIQNWPVSSRRSRVQLQWRLRTIQTISTSE